MPAQKLVECCFLKKFFLNSKTWDFLYLTELSYKYVRQRNTALRLAGRKPNSTMKHNNRKTSPVASTGKNSMRICRYNKPFKKIKYMASDSEVVDEHTPFFGLTILVEGDGSSKDLVDPITDIFYFERRRFSKDCLAPDELVMISQPMTLVYLKENIGRIKEVFDALSNAGMESRRDVFREIVVSTPLAAHKGREALRRVFGILYGSRKEMLRVGCDPYAFRSVEHFGISTVSPTKQLDELVDDHTNSFDDRPLKIINSGNEANPSVEYSFFRGTLDVNVIMAYVELVNNIIEMANSDKLVVTFSDLVDGDYLPELVDKRVNRREYIYEEKFELVNNEINKDISRIQAEETIPESEKAETIKVEDDVHYVNACIQALAMWIEQDGRFTNLLQNEDEWDIIDCNTLAESEPKFANLYEMRTTVNNVETIYHRGSIDSVRFREYSTIYLDCFATDNRDGTATIHYLSSSIGILINDGFVTDEMKDAVIRMRFSRMSVHPY